MGRVSHPLVGCHFLFSPPKDTGQGMKAPSQHAPSSLPQDPCPLPLCSSSCCRAAWLGRSHWDQEPSGTGTLGFCKSREELDPQPLARAAPGWQGLAWGKHRDHPQPPPYLGHAPSLAQGPTSCKHLVASWWPGTASQPPQTPVRGWSPGAAGNLWGNSRQAGGKRSRGLSPTPSSAPSPAPLTLFPLCHSPW